MAQLSVDRKQRLRTLENSIRKAAGEIQKNGLEIGRYLCEIRDDELWGDSHESWNQYLKEMADDLVGKSFAQAANLIRAAEIAKRLPDRVQTSVLEIPASTLTELGRLAPRSDSEGAGKDYSKIRTQDVDRVLKRASGIAGSETPSVRDVRKAVDIELGIDRTPKREEKAEDNKGIDLAEFLRRETGKIEGVIVMLADVPADGWKQLDKSHPHLVKRLATACDQLAELLRS